MWPVGPPEPFGGLIGPRYLFYRRRFKMKKIVIKTDCPEADNVLIACIRMLFPECEIQMLPVRTKSFKDVSMALDLEKSPV
jgi:hypothetical protein